MTVLMNDGAFLKKGYYISADKALLDKEAIYRFLKEESYWSQTLTPEKFERAIDNSMCFGVYKDDELAGFARVITDKANFAYICDVFILTKYRRQGLSKWLIQTITQHTDLQELRRWMLATADAHGLYKQFGFTEISKPERWMEIYRP